MEEQNKPMKILDILKQIDQEDVENNMITPSIAGEESKNGEIIPKANLYDDSELVSKINNDGLIIKKGLY